MKDLKNPPAPQDQPEVTPRRDRRALAAYRHGLTGHIILLTQTDQVAYQKHCEGYHRSLAPVGDLETDLVQSIADDRWRSKRAAAMESAILAAELVEPDQLTCGDDNIDTTLAMGRAWIAKGGNLSNLALYESRIQRRFEKNLAILRELQEKRAKDTTRVANDYRQLVKVAAAKGETFNGDDFPAEALPGGFVFSPAAIENLLIHQHSLRKAWDLPDSAAPQAA